MHQLWQLLPHDRRVAVCLDRELLAALFDQPLVGVEREKILARAADLEADALESNRGRFLLERALELLGHGVRIFGLVWLLLFVLVPGALERALERVRIHHEHRADKADLAQLRLAIKEAPQRGLYQNTLGHERHPTLRVRDLEVSDIQRARPVNLE